MYVRMAAGFARAARPDSPLFCQRLSSRAAPFGDFAGARKLPRFRRSSPQSCERTRFPQPACRTRASPAHDPPRQNGSTADPADLSRRTPCLYRPPTGAPCCSLERPPSFLFSASVSPWPRYSSPGSPLSLTMGSTASVWTRAWRRYTKSAAKATRRRSAKAAPRSVRCRQRRGRGSPRAWITPRL